MNSIEKEYEGYLGTVAEIMSAESLPDAVSLVKMANVRVEETGFDNWNGGTRIWTVYLSIPRGSTLASA